MERVGNRARSKVLYADEKRSQAHDARGSELGTSLRRRQARSAGGRGALTCDGSGACFANLWQRNGSIKSCAFICNNKSRITSLRVWLPRKRGEWRCSNSAALKESRRTCAIPDGRLRSTHSSATSATRPANWRRVLDLLPLWVSLSRSE